MAVDDAVDTYHFSAAEKWVITDPLLLIGCAACGDIHDVAPVIVPWSGDDFRVRGGVPIGPSIGAGDGDIS